MKKSLLHIANKDIELSTTTFLTEKSSDTVRKASHTGGLVSYITFLDSIVLEKHKLLQRSELQSSLQADVISWIGIGGEGNNVAEKTEFVPLISTECERAI